MKATVQLSEIVSLETDRTLEGASHASLKRVQVDVQTLAAS